MERALLVTVKFKHDKGSWSIDDSARELEELARACGAGIADTITCICDRPTPDLLIGKGKAEEIGVRAAQLPAGTIIFGHDLSGTQQRNLEDVIAHKTIDRTQLILDIFARRARSPEGKMQVELAQLQYLLPRLTGKGVILSRLGGGIGARGPGEQKLESDRRRIRTRIDRLRDDLRALSARRAVMRKKRRENDVPTAALVGYTNAGKSTLLNALTGAGQVVRDGLFTTLDPLNKRLILPGGEHVVVSDTVGFLHDLPHHLIESFKATLEEALEADILIHVVDASHPRVYEYVAAVFDVLTQLGAQEKDMITALNKIDLCEYPAPERLKRDMINPVAISALHKTNLDALLAKIQEFFAGRMEEREVEVSLSRMDIIDLLYREGKVYEIKYLQKGIRARINLPKVLFDKLSHGGLIRIID